MKYVLQSKASPSDYAVIQVKSFRILDHCDLMVVTTDIVKDATVFSDRNKYLYLGLVRSITKEDWIIVEMHEKGK